MPTLLALALVVLLAFTVETATGFGAMLVTVSLGAQFVPVSELLATVLPLNLLLSLAIAYRERDFIARTMLFRRILPWVLLGLPLGFFLRERLDPAIAVTTYGVFVVLLAVRELASRARAETPSAGAGAVALAMGGVVHGAFATGGPLIVWSIGRSLAGDKRTMRATLSALFFLLNLVLVAGLAASGSLTRTSLTASLWLGATLVPGALLGELLHRRVAEETFRRAVFVLLACAGLALVVRHVQALRQAHAPAHALTPARGGGKNASRSERPRLRAFDMHVASGANRSSGEMAEWSKAPPC